MSGASGAGGAGGGDPMMVVAMALAKAEDSQEQQMENLANKLDSDVDSGQGGGQFPMGGGSSSYNTDQAQLNVATQREKDLSQDLQTVVSAMGDARKSDATTN